MGRPAASALVQPSGRSAFERRSKTAPEPHRQPGPTYRESKCSQSRQTSRFQGLSAGNTAQPWMEGTPADPPPAEGAEDGAVPDPPQAPDSSAAHTSSGPLTGRRYGRGPREAVSGRTRRPVLAPRRNRL